MDLLTQPVGVSHYLAVSAVMFVCGLLCLVLKRNTIAVLMGVELMLNAAVLNLVAFSSPGLRRDVGHALELDGHLLALFVIVLAAGEAAVALAIALNFYNNHATIDIDHGDELRG